MMMHISWGRGIEAKTAGIPTTNVVLQHVHLNCDVPLAVLALLSLLNDIISSSFVIYGAMQLLCHFLSMNANN